MSDCELTETYSPADIDIAPATKPATPAIKTSFRVAAAAATPTIKLAGPMKLYTLYAPPNHRDGVVHATKADAEADKEHFDGKTTE